MVTVLGNALYIWKVWIPFGHYLMRMRQISQQIYEKQILNSNSTLTVVKLYTWNWYCVVYIGDSVSGLKSVSTQNVSQCVLWGYLISAFGQGLDNSVDSWLFCNPEAQDHHLASPHFLPYVWLLPVWYFPGPLALSHLHTCTPPLSSTPVHLFYPN